MDRFILESPRTPRTTRRVSHAERVPTTPYEALLYSISFEGRLSPARVPTHSRRLLSVHRPDIPSLNLSRRLTAQCYEDTFQSYRGWMRSSAHPQAEPTSIEAYRVLEAPGLEDDYYLSLLDWSAFTNTIAIGLKDRLFCWDAATETCSPVLTLDHEDTVASVSWMPESSKLAIGTMQGRVELIDVARASVLRRFTGHCKYRTGVLSWNTGLGLLSSGARDKMIVHHDPRTKEPALISQGHTQEVCGLKWDQSGSYLASGGNDNKVILWDPRNMAGPMTVYEKHVAAVKALAWSPHVPGLLASGGGTADRTIRFWNTRSSTSDSIKSVATTSQVCNMIWSPHAPELVTCHGFSEYQVMRWSYPNLSNTAMMMGHQQRVLHLCLSPDGRTVVTGSPDETLRFWRVFEERKQRRPNLLRQVVHNESPFM